MRFHTKTLTKTLPYLLVTLLLLTLGVGVFGVYRWNTQRGEGAQAAQNSWLQLGFNDYATLCTGSSANEFSPVTYPGAGNVRDVAGGDYHTLVADGTGRVWTSGANEEGQLGQGIYSTREAPGQLSATTNPAVDLTGIDRVFAGPQTSFALDTDTGRLWGWGSNDYGQLGNGTQLDALVPTQIFSSSVLDVAPGRDFTLFLRSDNSVVAAGNNSFGQLGDAQYQQINFPVSTGLTSGIVQIAAGDYFAAALNNAGEVYTWGLGDEGQLGQDTVTSLSAPTKIPGLTGVTHIQAAGAHVLASKSQPTGDELWEWGRRDVLSRDTDPANPGLVQNLPPTPTFTNLTRGRLSTTRETSAALSDGGQMIVWGQNRHGARGNGSFGGSLDPVAVPGILGATALGSTTGPFVQVVDAAGNVRSWGVNHHLTLGVSNTPRGADEFQVAPYSGARHVTSGLHHTLITQQDGTVLSCGSGDAGQLGLGNTTNQLGPTPILNLSGISLTSATRTGSYALSENGEVFEWGSTPNGTNAPQLVAGLDNVVNLATGADTLLALDASSDLYVYGLDSAAAGLGGATPLTPTLVASDVRDMACTTGGCAYVTLSGDVYTTGTNEQGQLGTGAFDSGTETYAANGLENITSLTARFETPGYVARSFGNEVYVWGSPALLGQGPGTRPTPVPTLLTRTENGAIVSYKNFTEFGLGHRGVWARASDGSLWNWGVTTPTRQTNVRNVVSIPDSVSGTVMHLRGDLPEPITNIVALEVECQTGIISTQDATQTTLCRFEIPAGRRLPDSLQIRLGEAQPSGVCQEVSGVAFCEQVVTSGQEGVNVIYVHIDGGSGVDTGETVYLDELDTDRDGLPDTWEVAAGLDPEDSTGVNGATGDLDSDGLTNINEYLYLTEASQADTDSDQINDFLEVNVVQMDPNDDNSDSAVTPDYDESFVPTTPGELPVKDGQEDLDRDGFATSLEIIEGTNPLDPDSRPATPLTSNEAAALVYYCAPGTTNGETLCEFYLPLDKQLPSLALSVGSVTPAGTCTLDVATRLVTCSAVPIGGASGLQDIRVKIGGDPVQDTGEDAAVDLLDTDGDGLPDEWEDFHNLNKNDDGSTAKENGAKGDPDSDGLTNEAEYLYGTNPREADTDGDNLSDSVEIGVLGTSPLQINSDSVRTTANEAANTVTDNNEDFDGDLYTNEEEILANSDAFDPSSIPATSVDSLDLISMVFFCEEGVVNSTTRCRANVPAGKRLTSPLNLAIGSNGTTSDPCTQSGFVITCQNVPTGPASGLQTIFGIVTGSVRINTGEKVRISASVQLDSDNDGLPDAWESENGLNSNDAGGQNGASGDPDNDGLSNAQEYNNGTNPNNPDTDGDGVNDGDEIRLLNTSPTDPDSNSLRTGGRNEAGNGTPDGLEDFDGDGFTNAQEIAAGTDPFFANSTPGSTFDSLDIQNLTVYCREGLVNAFTSCEFAIPSGKFLPPDFRMGVSNATPAGSCQASGSSVTCTDVPTGSFEGLQFIYGAIGNNPSVSTGERVRISAITLLDSDGDGLPDSWEIQYELDERNANDTNGASGDPDDDGYTNIEEFNFGTDPLRADTDGDGVNDQDEIELLGTDPLDPDSDSTRTSDRDEAGNDILDGDEDFDGDGFTNRQELFAGTDSFGDGQVPSGVGESGTPTAQPGGSGNGGSSSGGGSSGDGFFNEALDNLDGTDRTGGLPLFSLSLIILSLLALTSLASVSLFKRQKFSP